MSPEKIEEKIREESKGRREKGGFGVGRRALIRS
jgi:hypothetical protein